MNELLESVTDETVIAVRNTIATKHGEDIAQSVAVEMLRQRALGNTNRNWLAWGRWKAKHLVVKEKRFVLTNLSPYGQEDPHPYYGDSHYMTRIEVSRLLADPLACRIAKQICNKRTVSWERIRQLRNRLKRKLEKAELRVYRHHPLSLVSKDR